MGLDWPPDYVGVLALRQRRLAAMRAEPALALGAREYYRTRPAAFISDWCVTYDPRNAARALPTALPFVLFERQQALVAFLLACVEGEQAGLIEKCRDMGATWVCAAFSVWLWLFYPGAAIGWGSRKEQLVDRLGDPDSIFEKMRLLLRGLPRCFWPLGFSPADHMGAMKILNPATGATITGEAGDNIGRGGRKLVYFKDESAHYERAEHIEAALADNTRTPIDISSVNGTGNVFHRKREAGVEWTPGAPLARHATNVFVMDWRDHPAKTQAWHDERRARAERDGLLHVFAAEVERDYAASVEGAVIPGLWIQAAVDAHVKLGFDDSGAWCAGLDVADGGGDLNALAKRKGAILKSCEAWGERDTALTARRALAACAGLGPVMLNYDCIGVGAGVKAEANRLADEGLLPANVRLVAWNGAGETREPEARVVAGDGEGPCNRDFFANLKAQAWWALRRRFEATYRALNEPGFAWRADDLISLPSGLPLLRSIEKELGQPVASQGVRMKLVVDKQPGGRASPNLADAIVMAFWPAAAKEPLVITPQFAAQFSAAARRRR